MPPRRYIIRPANARRRNARPSQRPCNTRPANTGATPVQITIANATSAQPKRPSPRRLLWNAACEPAMPPPPTNMPTAERSRSRSGRCQTPQHSAPHVSSQSAGPPGGCQRGRASDARMRSLGSTPRTSRRCRAEPALYSPASSCLALVACPGGPELRRFTATAREAPGAELSTPGFLSKRCPFKCAFKRPVLSPSTTALKATSDLQAATFSTSSRQSSGRPGHQH